MPLERSAYLRVISRILPLKQTRKRLANLATTNDDENRRKQHRRSSVDPQHSSCLHEKECADDAQCGEQIREQMPTVTDERSRIVAFSPPKQAAACHAVEYTARKHEPKSEVEPFDCRPRTRHSFERMDEHHDTSKGNHDAFKRGTCEFRFAMAVGMLCISRSARIDDCGKRDDAGDDVHGGFKRIRKDRFRTSEDPTGSFKPEPDQTNSDSDARGNRVALACCCRCLTGDHDGSLTDV